MQLAIFNNRLTRFWQRHGQDAPRMAIWATLRSLYRREPVRRLVRPWVHPRRPEKWLFVVGCYNSGTTLTQQILSAHPDVKTLPWEGSLITSALPDPEDLGWTRMWIQCREYMKMPDAVQPERVDQLLRDWAPWWGQGDRGLSSRWRDRGGQDTAFLEKSITNSTRMEWLDRNLSPAYFLGVTRDGYCVAEGIRRKATPRPQVARHFGNVYPVELTARQWVAANDQMHDSGRRVTRYHQFRYEDLMADPLRLLDEIWDFFELTPPAVSLAGDQLVIDGTRIMLDKSMNAKSMARLTSAEVNQVTTVIADWQTKLGYELVS